jgi:hypothetical protein
MRVSLPQALVTFGAALIGSAVGIFLVLPLGLIASEFVIYPLALFVAALLASVGAGWAANFLSPDDTRTRLLHVAGATVGLAAIIAVVLLAIETFRVALLGPVIYIGVFSALVLALAASVAAWYFRTQEKGSRDGLITFGLIALAVLIVPVVIFLASLAGLIGA